MSRFRSQIIQRLFAWLVAVLVTAVLGSLIQTQLNLAALEQLGLPIEPAVRWQTSLDDLIGFAPTWAALVALAFLIAFPVAAGLMLWLPRWRRALLVLAGAVAIGSVLLAMRWSLGLTAIAAARSLTGSILLLGSGAVGGWVYWRLRRSARR